MFVPDENLMDTSVAPDTVELPAPPVINLSEHPEIDVYLQYKGISQSDIPVSSEIVYTVKDGTRAVLDTVSKRIYEINNYMALNPIPTLAYGKDLVEFFKKKADPLPDEEEYMLYKKTQAMTDFLLNPKSNPLSIDRFKSVSEIIVGSDELSDTQRQFCIDIVSEWTRSVRFAL